MQYSPRLKNAMEEIDEVMKRYAIGGVIILHTPGFCEFKSHISPPYSCAFFDYSIPNAVGIRFKAKASELPGGAAERNQKLADTENMFYHLNKSLLEHLEMFHHAYELFNKTTGGHDHGPGRMTGPQEQGN